MAVIFVVALAVVIAYGYSITNKRLKVLEDKVIKNPPQKSVITIVGDAIAIHERKYHGGR